MTATDQTDETSALIATLAGHYYTSADVSAREQSRNAWTCTIVECDWLYTADVVSEGRDVSRSVELFHRVNVQDFEACERTQPAMSSRAYRNGGVLVPAEHHIGEFHRWLTSRLGDTKG